MEKPYASAPARNAAPVLGVLRHELRDCSTVFEIGSGTGQHAVTFAAALPDLTWQTSDLGQSHDGIRAWIADAGAANVLPPLEFDVLSAAMPASAYDAVFSANTAHIMSYAAVCRMFELVGAMLNEAGVFCLYGPFSRAGAFIVNRATAPSHSISTIVILHPSRFYQSLTATYEGGQVCRS